MASLALTNNEGKTFVIATVGDKFEVPFTAYPYVMDLNADQMKKLKNWINARLREMKMARVGSPRDEPRREACAVCKSVGHSMVVINGTAYCGLNLPSPIDHPGEADRRDMTVIQYFALTANQSWRVAVAFVPSR